MTASAPPHDEQRLRHAQDEIAEIFGDIAVFWGFTRTQGRIYGLLFLSPEPLGHGHIQERLAISAGSTSMTLASLVHWGVLRRTGRLYEAESDMWKVITGVLQRRERDQVEHAIERTSAVLRSLGDARPDPAIRFALTRVKQLLAFFRLGRKFLDAFVSGRPVHGLLSTIAQRAAKFLPHIASEHDVLGH